MLNKYLLAAAIVATAGASQAATCDAGKVKYTLTQGNPDAVVASSCGGGNTTNTIDENWSLNGISGWTLADKTDDGDDYADGGFSAFSTPDRTWTVENPLGYDYVMVTLKQANTFAAFLLDATKDLTGTWLTKGPGKSIGSLSHASVYFAGEPDPPQPAPVPLPAGAVLLPAGLGALALLRRRKKNAA